MDADLRRFPSGLDDATDPNLRPSSVKFLLFVSIRVHSRLILLRGLCGEYLAYEPGGNLKDG
jgi:hypothetical protein